MFAGIPVKVSDRNTVVTGTPNTYETLLMKKGALAFWYNGQPTVEMDRDILADTDIAALHIYWVAHLYRRSVGGTKPGAVKLVTR